MCQCVWKMLIGAEECQKNMLSEFTQRLWVLTWDSAHSVSNPVSANCQNVTRSWMEEVHPIHPDRLAITKQSVNIFLSLHVCPMCLVSSENFIAGDIWTHPLMNPLPCDLMLLIYLLCVFAGVHRNSWILLRGTLHVFFHALSSLWCILFCRQYCLVLSQLFILFVVAVMVGVSQSRIFMR